jgi:hypothetical protein
MARYSTREGFITNGILRALCVVLGLPILLHTPRVVEGTVDLASCTAFACEGEQSCSAIDGSGSTGCTLDSSGCREHLGVCIRAVGQLIEDFGILKDDLVRIDDLYLAHVGNGRYAAWNCEGEVIRLVARLNGGWMDLPTGGIDALEVTPLSSAVPALTDA